MSAYQLRQAPTSSTAALAELGEVFRLALNAESRGTGKSDHEASLIGK